ncbi:amino acid ABC transporter ATP-binding/permease protein [Boudabousia tangfeifanii]|nr:ABC transporter ATP-binding protein [Boudabousia tangfeifanii]
METKYSRWDLTRWMFAQTRPVLLPLLASATARVADQLLGVVMLAFAAAQVVAQLSDMGIITAPAYDSPWPGVLGPQTPWFFAAQPLWVVLSFLAGIAVVKAFLRYLEQFCGHFVAFKALELLRREAFVRLYPQAPAILGQSRAGDLLVRLTRDIDRIEVFFAHTFAPAVSALVLPWLTALLLWITTGSTSLAFLLVALNYLSLILILVLGRGTSQEGSLKTLAARQQVATISADVLGGKNEINAYGLWPEFATALGKAREEVHDATKSTHLQVSLRRGVTLGMMLLQAFVLTFVAYPLVYDGALPAAALAAILAGSMRGWESVRGVEDFSTFLENSFAAAARLRSLTSNPPVPSSASGTLPAGDLDLRAEAVTFAYAEETPKVLDQVDFSAPAGSWTALLGRTGGGKSTLAKMFVRYDDPQSGRVLVGGKDLKEVDVDDLRQQVLYVPQRTHLFAGTIAENLRLVAPDASEAELWQVLKVVGLATEVEAMPHGLETKVGTKGEDVSGGQRQRLALARAVLASPKVLIMDEATAHLPTSSALQVRAAIRQALPTATILEITHRKDELVGVDHIVSLD